jgi:hypothetical protein
LHPAGRECRVLVVPGPLAELECPVRGLSRPLEFAEDELTVRQALVERPVEAGIAPLQRKRLVAEKQLVVLLMTMEVVESSCLVEHEREPAPAVVLGVG